MHFVFAVVDAHRNPLLHTVAGDEEMSIRLFMHARPEKNGAVLTWENWKARGYSCVRFSLNQESGLGRRSEP